MRKDEIGKLLTLLTSPIVINGWIEIIGQQDQLVSFLRPFEFTRSLYDHSIYFLMSNVKIYRLINDKKRYQILEEIHANVKPKDPGFCGIELFRDVIRTRDITIHTRTPGVYLGVCYEQDLEPIRGVRVNKYSYSLRGRYEWWRLKVTQRGTYATKGNSR